LTRQELFSLLTDSRAAEWRDKVGVVGPTEGSAKTTLRLLAVDGWVLKTNTALGTDIEGDAVAKVAAAVALGAATRIWHPDKTWAVYRADSRWYPLSATPELVTLRRLEERSKRMRAWTAMLEQALEVSTRHGIGLDLNPANFGTLAGDARLYYIDDEWYPQLKVAEIASSIVARIPEEIDVGEDEWSSWGTALGGVLRPFCQGVEAASDLLTALSEHPLAPLFENKRAALCAAVRRAIENPKRNEAPVSNDSHYRRSGGLTAVFGDVHANKPALDAVLRECARVGVDNYLFLGDVVGYGPHPRECVQALAELPNALFVRGNHDHAIGTGVFREGMNQLARSCADWTFAQLSAEEREWLLSLPLDLGGDGWLAVHGAPKDPRRFLAYVYELTFQDNLEYMAASELGLCFYGHTHVQFVHERTADGRCAKLGRPECVSVERSKLLLVNPGSVGQPRDHDPRAAFSLWDRRRNVIGFQRVGYEIENVVAALQANGLPLGLQERLIQGR